MLLCFSCFVCFSLFKWRRCAALIADEKIFNENLKKTGKELNKLAHRERVGENNIFEREL